MSAIKNINNFKKGIRFFTSIIASREFALIYCIFGTIAQIAHTLYLTESISSLDGWWKTGQAIIVSIFISSSLLFFVSIADKDEPDYNRVSQAIILFTIIEILINIYYYIRHLVIEPLENNSTPLWFDFIFATIIGALIPYTIKLYSSQIRAKEWLKALSSDEEKPKHEYTQPGIDEETLRKMEERLDGMIARDEFNDFKTFFENRPKSIENNDELEHKINSMVVEAFQNNSDKFLNQFKNKVKYITENTDDN